MPRARNTRPISVAVTPSGDQWVSFVTVGRKPNGAADRRKRATVMCASCKTEPRTGCGCWNEHVAKVRELEDTASAGTLPKAGRAPTVESFFTRWLTDIAPYQISGSAKEPLRRRTLDQYWSFCRRWLFPHCGGVLLSEFDSDDLDRLYGVMYAAGLRPSSVSGGHSIIRRGLSLALQRGLVTRNWAKDRDNPGASRRRKRALSVDQAKAVLAAIDARPDRLRWRVGLAIGPRQGEALAVRWSHLDLDEGTVDLSWQLARLTWLHGCDDPRSCGTHVVPTVCPGGPKHDRYHRAGCPKPRGKLCPPKCAGHAARCPKRHGGGLTFQRPKTWRDESDTHIVGLPAAIVAELREHRKTQAATRLKAGSRWEDHDLVFCQANGRPLEPRKDFDRWRSVLHAAGIEASGTHIMRATAATMLLELGEDLAVVQEVLGHSSLQTTRGYTTVSVGLTRRAAEKMADFLGTATDLATERERRRSAG